MIRLTLCLLLAGCTPDLTPTWAADTVHLEASPDGVVGFHTWTLYGPAWDKGRRPRHHACTLVYQVDLTGSEDRCEGCERVWTADERLTDSDCADDVTWLPPQLAAIGVGDLDPELVGGDPWPDASLGSWVRYDDGDWLSHGWAIPEEPPLSQVSLPATAWPAWTWPVDP